MPDLGGQVITIAVDNAYLPFSYIPADTGVAEGWDYDAMDEICARINCVPSFQEFVWDGTIIATGEGQFNMAAGGITITEARDLVVDFSDSFISTDQKILVAKDNADIGSRADLEAAACTLGSMTGTTNYDLAVDVVGESRIAAFESFAFAVQALISGDVCAVIMDDVAGQGYQGGNADQVSMLDEVLTSDPLGFAFTEGSDLVAPFNAAIQSMKDDGTLAALNTKYFGTAFSITYDDIEDGVYAEEPAVGAPETSAQPLGSRSNPIPLGATTDAGEGWSLTITGVNLNAGAELAQIGANSWVMESGTYYPLVDLEMRYDGQDEPSRPSQASISTSFFSAVGDGTQVVYTTCFLTLENRFSTSASVFAGAVISGQLCIDAVDPSDIDSLLLFTDSGYGTENIFFATR